jgi:hypothetical protein
MVHVSVQVVSSYVTPWLSNTGLISVISFVITLYFEETKVYVYGCLHHFQKNIPDPKNELPVKHKIHYRNEVVKVKWDNLAQEYMNKVIVKCSDGTSYIADFVIMTVSLGVMKEKAQSMFQPALPSDKLNAIKVST